jgi:hypothetical protein
VVVTRQENLFELAMEHYGRANWEIVEKIRATESGITNSLSYVREVKAWSCPIWHRNFLGRKKAIPHRLFGPGHQLFGPGKEAEQCREHRRLLQFWSLGC